MLYLFLFFALIWQYMWHTQFFRMHIQSLLSGYAPALNVIAEKKKKCISLTYYW